MLGGGPLLSFHLMITTKWKWGLEGQHYEFCVGGSFFEDDVFTTSRSSANFLGGCGYLLWNMGFKRVGRGIIAVCVKMSLS